MLKVTLWSRRLIVTTSTTVGLCRLILLGRETLELLLLLLLLLLDRETLKLRLLRLLLHLILLLRHLRVLALRGPLRLKEVLPYRSPGKTLAKNSCSDALQGIRRVVVGVRGYINLMAVVAIE